MLLKETLLVRALGFIKIPLIAYVRPTVIAADLHRAEVKIPFCRRNKNHLGSMYFGVLAIGADCVGGLLTFPHMRKAKKKIDLVFKDFHADFLKRPEADVHFIATDNGELAELVRKVVETGERHHSPISIIATTPSISGDEPVAKFTLTVSLKVRKHR